LFLFTEPQRQSFPRRLESRTLESETKCSDKMQQYRSTVPLFHSSTFSLPNLYSDMEVFYRLCEVFLESKVSADSLKTLWKPSTLWCKFGRH